MKKVLLAVAGILFAATSFAQNALVASLSSGGDVTYYYGVTALEQAVTAAKSGDIINLSGGTFYAADINKAIAIRGTGIACSEPTIIINGFTIDIPSDDTNRFSMEGIKCTGMMYLRGTFANPYFLKCQFDQIGRYRESDAISNIMFVNSKITGKTIVGGVNTYYFVNSYVSNIEQKESASMTGTNCIINSVVAGLTLSQWFNCIFFTNSYTERQLPAGSKATNCYCPEYNGSNYAYGAFNADCVNCGLYDYEDMFKDFTGKYTDDQTFELAEGATTKFPGLNGEQIGLYGGLQPYNSTPSYPLITKMAVGEKTNETGQLSVTIEVK